MKIRTILACAAVNEARHLGDKPASGGAQARDEVIQGFDSLASALNKPGRSVGSKSKASSLGKAA